MRAGGRRAPIGELLRYGAVGGGIVVIDYVVYLAIVRVSPDAAVLANLVARLLAGITGFFGHACFTFGDCERSAHSAMRYAALLATNTMAASLLLMAMLPLFGIVFAKLASDGIVIIAAYLASRYLVFAPTCREAMR